MRACDDEQGSSSPVRHECNEQGRSARAQGSSPALCRGPRAMDEWAWAKARHGSRVWAASELRHNTRCLAQERAASRVASASSRATSAAPSIARAHSERCRAPSERWLARTASDVARPASDVARTASDGSRALRAIARVRWALARAASTNACGGLRWGCSSYATSAWAARTWPAMAVCVRPMGVQCVGCLRYD